MKAKNVLLAKPDLVFHQVKTEELHRRRLALEGVNPSVCESGRAMIEGVDALARKQDRVAGGLGELLDAGSDVDSVTDQRELQLASAADGSGDHLAGVDP